MNLILPCTGARPASGEEVMAMDDVDVNVSHASVSNTLDLKERMGKQ